LPHIALIEDLTIGQIPVGSYLLVEYDPTSQWYNASLTIAARWVKSGGRVNYHTFAQPPQDIRPQLEGLGLSVSELENTERLQIWDGYTTTLGQKSTERYAYESLKVADLSLWYAKRAREPLDPESLLISDNLSTMARFSDEKLWVELALSRVIPARKSQKMTAIRGVIRGVHSDFVYKQLEAAADGVIDFKLDETSDPAQNLIRIRSLRNVGFDGRWHKVKIAENLEVTIA
jgi:KaiC/GvpD/RAD55 family RecA-like ATPase